MLTFFDRYEIKKNAFDNNNLKKKQKKKPSLNLFTAALNLA